MPCTEAYKELRWSSFLVTLKRKCFDIDHARNHLRTVPSPNWYSSFKLFMVHPSSKYSRMIFFLKSNLSLEEADT